MRVHTSVFFTDSRHRIVAGVREKLCGGCNQWKPRYRAHFYAHGGKPDGMQSQCRTCVGSKMRERARRISQALTQAREFARAAIGGKIAA